MFNYLSKKGFTLIELLVVVIILSLLVAIGMPSYMTSLETTKAREAITLARQWQAGRAIYFAENGAYPRNNTLDAIGLDVDPGAVVEGRYTSLLSSFIVDVRDNTKITFENKKKDNNTPATIIEATDTTLVCCAQTTKNQKVCSNLASSQTTSEKTWSTYGTYTCYDLGESD